MYPCYRMAKLSLLTKPGCPPFPEEQPRVRENEVQPIEQTTQCLLTDCVPSLLKHEDIYHVSPTPSEEQTVGCSFLNRFYSGSYRHPLCARNPARSVNSLKNFSWQMLQVSST